MAPKMDATMAAKGSPRKCDLWGDTRTLPYVVDDFHDSILLNI